MGKYSVLAAVCLGTVISAYLSSCVNIALPDIQAQLSFSADSIVWVSLSYLIPYGSMLPLTGKLGDKYGAKQMYVAGLACFSVGSLLCGMATGSAFMIVFRVIQGIGGGILLPNAMSIVAVNYTGTARATALGLWSATTAVGTAFGPTVGGYLIELLDWRAMFFSVLPFCAIGVAMAVLMIPKSDGSKEIPLDVLGSVLLVSCVSCLLIAMNQGEKEGWLSSQYIVSLLYGGAASLVLFVLAERQAASPIFDFSLFRRPDFFLANFIAAVTYFTMQSTTYLLPFFLKNVLTYDSIQAGLMLLPQTLAMVVFAAVSGRLNIIFGPRPLTFFGIGATVGAFWLLKEINLAFGPRDFFVPLVIYGLGLGVTMSPTTTCAISRLRKAQLGVGSGILNFFKLMGSSVGVVVAQISLNRREIFHTEQLKAALHAAHDPFSVYQLLDGLQTRHFFGGTFDASAATLLWSNGMGVSLEKYAKFQQMLARLVTEQARVGAFQDTFFILACLSAVALAATVFLDRES